MLRNISPSNTDENQRSKGPDLNRILMFKLKLALCFWILYIQPACKLVTAQDDVPEVQTLVLGPLQLTLSSKLLLDLYSPRAQKLTGYLGWLPSRSNISYTNCSQDDSSTDSICLKYGKHMQLTIAPDDMDQCNEDTMVCQAVSCYKIHWRNHVSGSMDCFVIGDNLWYGGGEVLSQTWPIRDERRSWYPAVTGDPLHHPAGNVIENIWLSSGGFLIYVDPKVPLYVSFNESGSEKFCFSTSSKKYPYHNNEQDRKLTYSICTAMNIKEVYVYLMQRWLKKPRSIPEERVFQFPVWSTWARYKRNISEEQVLKFSEEIKEQAFASSQLEIDDKWENCYGDLEFDAKKFPNPKEMIEELTDSDFPVTLWVHPFCNSDCKTYKIGEDNGYWVKNKNGETLEVKWWNGNGAVLDTTNQDATDWFESRLRRLQTTYGVESFKFDAGELLWLEQNFTLHDPKANVQPNLYSQSYAELASRFGGRVEVRVGHNSQEFPLFVRMMDKYSRWDYANGLQTLIPTALQLSFLGYPFIIPDMIGGNNYEPSKKQLPDRELYIRWMQASTFLPVMQFSITPWDYDAEVVQIAKKMGSIHEKYSRQILNLAKQATGSGLPIIRPLWWVSPEDIETLQSDSQFMVGDTIMVAPVLQKGATSRNIYLPEGKWSDVQRGNTFYGPQWLTDYEAPLHFLPFFVRQSELL